MRFSSPLLGLAIALLGTTARAEVQTSAASIAWEAPADCPDEPEVVRQVEALLGETLHEAKPQALRFVAHVQAEQQADYRLLLRVSGSSGELTRELTHPNCDKLTEAASLVIALAIDPERVQAAQRGRDPGAVPADAAGATAPIPAATTTATPAATTTATPAATTTATPAAATPATAATTPATAATTPATAATTPATAAAPAIPAPATPATTTPGAAGASTPMDATAGASNASSNVGVMLSAGALAGAGVLPNTSFGVELGFAATLAAAASLGAFVELWAPSEERIPDASEATLRMRQVSLGARGCWMPALGGLRGVGCLAGEVGQLTGEGQHVAGARESVAGWGGVRAELGVLLPLGPGSSLLAGGAAGVSLARPRFGLIAEDGTEIEAFQPDAWYVRGKVAALLTFD